MAESGGPSTQDGIFYQNTVAAHYLADLLDLSPLPPRERIVDVRLEAPSHVDDVVVHYADGHRDWIQAKVSIQTSGDNWDMLWAHLSCQSASNEFGVDDRLIITVGEANEAARNLRDLSERASTALNAAEWTARLGDAHKKVLKAIVRVLKPGYEPLELLRRITVDLKPLDEMQRAFERRRLSTAFALSARFLAILRDIAGGGARRRALFLAAPLRGRLLNEYGIDVVEPTEWGLAAYRATIKRLARIEIPGTGVSGSCKDLFVWPRARDLDRTGPTDFEAEDSSRDYTLDRSTVDLQNFPSDALDRCIVVAGPGYGKSALLQAVADRLVQSAYIPVLIPLAMFASTGVNVSEFLTDDVNRDYDVKVGWSRLSEQGLTVLLFDGLDEIPATQRRAVLNRIATFSARYPLVPWMLTVRDAAVLSGPAEARMIELLPLNSQDKARFANAMRGHIAGFDRWKFTRHLELYPDLDRLARIPLFLTMMMALSLPGQPLPKERSDLIEAYLRTLFHPEEHKSMNLSTESGGSLRDAAEFLAFDSLEKQEIGFTERELQNLASTFLVSGNSVALVSQLLGQGILRRQSAARIQFPYPIVQEYLAACYIVNHQPDTLASRIEDCMQRPWAQVVQFALELHPNPGSIIDSMLGRPDDAFVTGLRLVARCIVNGAKVSDLLRANVARRLIAIWPVSSWRLRDRLGRLIVDGFSKPMLPELRAVLGKRWLIEDGVGEIVCNFDDTNLTMEVLDQLLEHSLERFCIWRSLQPAINKVADSALLAYRDKTLDYQLSDDQKSGLSDLIGAVDPSCVTQSTALEIALNERLTDELRLEAFSVATQPTDIRAEPLIARALRSEYYGDQWAALKAISRGADPEKNILCVLLDENVALSRRKEIAGRISNAIVSESRRKVFVHRNAANQSIHPGVRQIFQALSARFGDAETFYNLVENAANLDRAVVGATIALLGHYPDRALGLELAKKVEIRVCDAEEAALYSHSAVIGMTSLYEMDSFDMGGISPAPPHPSADVWAELVARWVERNDASCIQRIRIATAASELGSKRAVDVLEGLILSIADPDAEEYDREDEYGHSIRSGIDRLRQKRRLLPLSLCERFARAKRPNVPFGGIDAIAAHRNREALDLLIAIHNNPSEKEMRGDLLHAIENVSVRLELAIVRTGRNLKVVNL